MFELMKHQHEYQYGMRTVISNLLPVDLCLALQHRVKELSANGSVSLVNHSGKGTLSELDGGGEYLHHIFKGGDIRQYFPELVGAYHALLPIVSAVTCTKTLLSPYPESDINIKAYPAGGGTIGGHFDTNAITVLVYLTTNTEAPLEIEISRAHPSRPEGWVEYESIYAQAGSMLLMKGRDVWHCSKPTDKEEKTVAIFNYYVEGDTWRPEQFDAFVYEGSEVSEVV